jgi:hypothetical protein
MGILLRNACSTWRTVSAMIVMRHDAGSPLWLWIIGIALMVPAAWLGGAIGTRSRQTT